MLVQQLESIIILTLLLSVCHSFIHTVLYNILKGNIDIMTRCIILLMFNLWFGK